MKRFVAVLALALLLAGATGVASGAGGDGGPLADAGLDQTVSQNTTVQLDGTGSSHPNGTIRAYEWSIRTPTGRTIAPNCRDCARTTFPATEVGRYDVTLTVTDSEGRTDRDTLYVYVEEAGPTVELDGPTAPPVDEARTYNATAGTTNAELRNLTWKIGTRTVNRESMTGQSAHRERGFIFEQDRTYVLKVVVRDSSNRTARDSLRIQPTAPDTSDNPEASDSTSGTADRGDTYNTRDCSIAGVVQNPTGGNGTAAAVTCADDTTGDNTTDRAFDETCSARVDDCEYADSNGQNTNAVDSVAADETFIDVSDTLGSDDVQDLSNIPGVDSGGVSGRRRSIDTGRSGNSSGGSSGSSWGSSDGSTVDWSDLISAGGYTGSGSVF